MHENTEKNITRHPVLKKNNNKDPKGSVNNNTVSSVGRDKF